MHHRVPEPAMKLSNMLTFLLIVTLSKTLYASIDISSDLSYLTKFSSALDGTGAASHHESRKLQECTDIGFDDEIFQDRTFDIDAYVTYDGLDFTALFASSIAMSDDYVVVGSDGYDIFKGIVHVYQPISAVDFGTQSIIRSPTHDNANFGVSVALDGDRILVGANGYNVYDGAVFSYEWTLDTYWQLRDTISSPLAGLNVSQGFGYRIAMSDGFALISTAANNAYIYEHVGDAQYVLNTDLAPPDEDVRFGRSVAMSGDLAIVGATGVGGSEGAAYIYRRYNGPNSTVYWDLEEELQSVLGYSTYFGYSVAINSDVAVVGATGYRPDTWDPRGERLANNTGWVHVFHYNTETQSWNSTNITTISSPVGDDGSFGSSLSLLSDSLLIGADGFPCGTAEGSAFLFRMDNAVDDSGSLGSGRKLLADGDVSSWSLNKSFPSIDGEGSHFGWQVGLSPSYLAVGAYGYQDLQGSIHLAARTVPFISDSPTLLPTFLPTESPSGVAAGLNVGGSNPDENEDLQLGLIVALMLAVLLAAIATGTAIWCCCCLVVPIAAVKKKKKKKKEEENSPYTVHSYRGYAETDEYEYSEYEPSLITETYIPAPPTKKSDKTVKFMDDEALRNAFPYKVYGPRGYQEGQNMDEDQLMRMKVEANGNDKNLKFGAAQPPPSAWAMHDPRRAHHPHQHYHHNHSPPRSMHSGSSMNSSYYTSGSSSQFDSADDASEYSDDYSRSYSSGSSATDSQSQSMYSRDASQSHYSSVGSESRLSAAQQSKVDEARAKYRAFKERSSVSSQSASGTGSSGNTHSSQVASLVESARARGREIARMASETSGDMVMTVEGTTEGADGADTEDRSVVSGSSGGSQSYVSEARARYAAIAAGVNPMKTTTGILPLPRTSPLNRAPSSQSQQSGLQSQSQSLSPGPVSQSSEGGAVSSDNAVMRTGSADEDDSDIIVGRTGVRKSAKSLVEAAKARYASFGRSNSSRSQSASVDESDARSRHSAETSSSRGSEGTGGSMIDQARARYRAIRGIDNQSTRQSVDDASVSASGTASSFVPEFVQKEPASVSSAAESSLDVQSSSTAAHGNNNSNMPTSEHVRNAREAAMSKFALYKAKAEEEARKRAYDEQRMQEQVLLERRAIEEAQRARDEEDDRVDKAVEDARLRAEMSEIEARAAARARVEEEHLSFSEKQHQEREERRILAQERARANFAKFKAESTSGSSNSDTFSTSDTGGEVGVGGSSTEAVVTAHDVLLAARAKMDEAERNLEATRQISTASHASFNRAASTTDADVDADALMSVQRIASSSTDDNTAHAIASQFSTSTAGAVASYQQQQQQQQMLNQASSRTTTTSTSRTTTTNSTNHSSSSQHTFSSATDGQN